MAMKDISDRQVLLAYMQSYCEREILGTQDYRFPYKILVEWTGQPEKICYRCMERADGRGLLCYGVSLRTGWIEPKGYALLGVENPEKVYQDHASDRRRLALYKRVLAKAGHPVNLVAPERKPEPPRPPVQDDPFSRLVTQVMIDSIVGRGPVMLPVRKMGVAEWIEANLPDRKAPDAFQQEIMRHFEAFMAGPVPDQGPADKGACPMGWLLLFLVLANQQGSAPPWLPAPPNPTTAMWHGIVIGFFLSIPL